MRASHSASKYYIFNSCMGRTSKIHPRAKQKWCGPYVSLYGRCYLKVRSTWHQHHLLACISTVLNDAIQKVSPAEKRKLGRLSPTANEPCLCEIVSSQQRRWPTMPPLGICSATRQRIMITMLTLKTLAEYRAFKEALDAIVMSWRTLKSG